ncbi:MAG: hypothetical protein CL985_03095 [Euryarchaeota archaeon]|nr:hypothetical protein [Euryarchaeota archaeon]
MATLTVQGVEDALIDVCGSRGATSAQFRKELNLALPRLYNMGMWRDLLYEHVVTTTGSSFTIPDSAESIINAVVDFDSSSTDFSTPQVVRSQFHDYRLSGRDDDNDTLAIYGIVDDGYSATVEEPVAGKTYSLKLQPISPATTIPASGKVHVTFSDGTGISSPTADHSVSMGGRFNCGGQASLTTSTTSITSISEIRVGTDELSAPVKLTWEEEGSSTSLVAADDLQQANQVTRYRRYRISNDNDKTVQLRLLLKRKFKTLLSSTDTIYISSLNAIKHALLGSTAETNADLERSNFHWAVCQQILEEQLDAHRGAAKPTIFFNADGNRTVNIM